MITSQHSISSEYFEKGQSLWFDNIQRKLLTSGQFQKMIESGDIRGITSNPTIFQQAISKSNDYDQDIQTMSWAGMDAESIFYNLAIQDIQNAAALFEPLYTSSNKLDGYVSLEVSPTLAHDTQATIDETKRLWERVNRPNLMVKIPATREGIPAIRKVISEGINVNVTLIFSQERYAEVINAYLCGLEDRLQSGQSLEGIASVASFFVSRLDSNIDRKLAALGTEKSKSMSGKAAVANAALAYSLFEKEFYSPRFEILKRNGAQFQRPLWASTSTKNPDYPDLLYVDTLIAPHTVNTVPPKTLTAILDHGNPSVNIAEQQKLVPDVMNTLADLGISMSQATQELEEEGVASFLKAYTDLLHEIDKRKNDFIAELGPLSQPVQNRLKNFISDATVSRMFAKDPTLWSNNPDAFYEIQHRLGWLDSPKTSLANINQYKALKDKVIYYGYTQVMLLGMGGSSMAPEVYSEIQRYLRPSEPGLPIIILDTTDPAQVTQTARSCNPLKTLYIVASKSGSTAEIDALFHYFWSITQALTGPQAGLHFVAITDPGSSLEKLALENQFLAVFHGDPAVGGRFSALTAFGLVPAILAGIDPIPLLTDAEQLRMNCLPESNPTNNRGLLLGAILAEAWKHGKDKLTLLSDEPVKAIGAWIEQLIAESSGKTEKGIIPVDLEPACPVEAYHSDRLFVYFKNNGMLQQRIDQITSAGHPVITLEIPTPASLGSQFFVWEYATAIACTVLNVNAFDQPDVQDSKSRTINKIKEYTLNHTLKSSSPQLEDEHIQIFLENAPHIDTKSPLEAIKAFLKQATDFDYVAINAYLPRNSDTLSALQHFRKQVMNITKCTTTLGYGPRFLHSTGQLHKGGPDHCLFVQITGEITSEDPLIPAKPYSFGILQTAQAQGDMEALVGRNRRVLRIHLKQNKLPDLA